MRGYQLCFPRGYGEAGISSEENARKEIEEELGAKILKLERLGQVVADSGLNGNKVDVYYCEIGQPCLKEGYEGIRKLEYYTAEELAESIKVEGINDGFTLSALGLLKNRPVNLC
jgi:ADP-ribose pyrophosphatase